MTCSGIPPGETFTYVVPVDTSGQWGTYWAHSHYKVLPPLCGSCLSISHPTGPIRRRPAHAPPPPPARRSPQLRRRVHRHPRRLVPRRARAARRPLPQHREPRRRRARPGLRAHLLRAEHNVPERVQRERDAPLRAGQDVQAARHQRLCVLRVLLLDRWP